jgi:hypothetical protein
MDPLRLELVMMEPRMPQLLTNNDPSSSRIDANNWKELPHLKSKAIQRHRSHRLFELWSGPIVVFQSKESAWWPLQSDESAGGYEQLVGWFLSAKIAGYE